MKRADNQTNQQLNIKKRGEKRRLKKKREREREDNHLHVRNTWWVYTF